MRDRYSCAVSRLARILAATALAGGALSSHPGLLFAREPAKTEDTASPAGPLVERGIALRRSGDDTAALELFQQAEQLEPDSTRIKVHLAATYQALGQWEEADRYLTQAVENPSDPYVVRHQSTLASARAAIDKRIGLLQLSGGPPGTEVRLNGRPLGTLPIGDTVRVAAGIYTLEAQLPGYYSITRSVALAGGALVRESITLAPLSQVAARAAPVPAAPAAVESNQATWLPWMFGGLALGAAGLTVGAWAVRESHADQWNDDSACLSSTQTREQLCGSELDDGQKAETWMWIGGIGTAAFAAAAVVTVWIQAEDKEAPVALGCALGLAQLNCVGHF